MYLANWYHEFILFDIIYMSNINLNAKSKYDLKCTFKVTHTHKWYLTQSNTFDNGQSVFTPSKFHVFLLHATFNKMFLIATYTKYIILYWVPSTHQNNVSWYVDFYVC